jgi:hypothetical protein
MRQEYEVGERKEGRRNEVRRCQEGSWVEIGIRGK